MEAGSIQEVTERLKSWCILHENGLARVEWDSAYARQDVVDRLKGLLGDLGISVVEVPLPPGETVQETVAGLIEELRSRSGSVVSITGIEWAFPAQGKLVDTLAALSFQRERLALLPVRQIWWVPSHLTEEFILGVPDLDSWFKLRLHLTETPDRSSGDGGQILETGRKTVSVAEARFMALRFWERLGAARGQELSEDRIWTELAQPAVDALLSAGLQLEAAAIQQRMPNTRERLEDKIEELCAARGPEDPEVLSITERLAALLRDRGDLASARRLEEQVVEVRARVLGAEHPDTLGSMNNLASTLSQQGDHAGARRLQEQVLEVSTRVLGAEHPDTLGSMNNLASTLRQQGDHAGARRLQEQVVEVRTRVLGAEHPDTLTSMNNLASTLSQQGDHAGARRLQEQVVEVRTRVLGAEHPDTLRAMNNLASTLSQQGDHAGARRLQEQVLEVRTRVLGAEHPATLRAMGNLAMTLFQVGEREASVQMLRRCVAGRRRVLGEGHPDTVAAAEALREWEKSR